jgi:ABC-type multidrug transport system fused ATPase/permease subunit
MANVVLDCWLPFASFDSLTMKSCAVDNTEATGKASNEDDKSIKVVDDGTEGRPVSLFKLLSLARKERCMLVIGLFIMVTVEASGLFIPILTAQAYDDLVDTTLTPDERMSNINWTMGLVLAIHMGGVVLSFLRTAIMGIAGERVVARTRNFVYSCILRQEVAFFDRTKSGELVSRLGSDTALLEEGTSLALPEVVVGSTTVLVSIAIMFWISPKLAGLLVALVVFIMAICVPFAILMGKLSKSYQDVLGKAQTYSTEALGAIRTVQSFAAEEREKERYRHFIGDPDRFTFWWPTDCRVHQTTYSIGFFKALTVMGFYTCIFGLGFAGMFVCLWYGFKLVNDGEISLGKLTAFQSYIFQIGASLGTLSTYVAKLIEATGAAARLFYLIERVPAIPTPGDSNATGMDDDEAPHPPKKPKSLIGSIDFNQVTFSYPARPDVEVLRNFSLSIPANETAALVGASGSGEFSGRRMQTVLASARLIASVQTIRQKYGGSLAATVLRRYKGIYYD